MISNKLSYMPDLPRDWHHKQDPKNKQQHVKNELVLELFKA